MTRWRLTIEYDGGPFMGWQRQEHGPSVQQSLEEALERMTGEQAAFTAAGRTDAGVHALAMSAHVDVMKPLTPHRLREGLNALVRPQPISVLDAAEVADDWHARFSCVGRRYLYRILGRRAPPALDAGRVWHIAVPLDAEAMAEGAQHLVGRHDFTTFRSAHCQSDSPVKTLDRLEVRTADEEIHVTAAARSFLHHQVRSMVGCLAMVGRGQWRPADMKKALEARDRSALGFNAPPHGLYFVEAVYPERRGEALNGAFPSALARGRRKTMTDHKKKGDFDQARKHDIGGNKKAHSHARNSRTSHKQNSGHGGRH